MGDGKRPPRFRGDDVPHDLLPRRFFDGEAELLHTRVFGNPDHLEDFCGRTPGLHAHECGTCGPELAFRRFEEALAVLFDGTDDGVGCVLQARAHDACASGKRLHVDAVLHCGCPRIERICEAYEPALVHGLQAPRVCVELAFDLDTYARDECADRPHERVRRDRVRACHLRILHAALAHLSERAPCALLFPHLAVRITPTSDILEGQAPFEHVLGVCSICSAPFLERSLLVQDLEEEDVRDEQRPEPSVVLFPEKRQKASKSSFGAQLERFAFCSFEHCHARDAAHASGEALFENLEIEDGASVLAHFLDPDEVALLGTGFGWTTFLHDSERAFLDEVDGDGGSPVVRRDPLTAKKGGGEAGVGVVPVGLVHGVSLVFLPFRRL